jgi:hypothetical protein
MKDRRSPALFTRGEISHIRIWSAASADGTKWDLYPQNLMSEYHIRYRGYGGRLFAYCRGLRYRLFGGQRSNPAGIFQYRYIR